MQVEESAVLVVSLRREAERHLAEHYLEKHHWKQSLVELLSTSLVVGDTPASE